MTIFRVIYALLVAITFGIFMVMVLWTLPEISASANGLKPFDLRPSGYSFEEAIAFLQAISDEGRDIYLGIQHTLDIFYPVLLAMVLVIFFTQMTSFIWAGILSLIAIAGAVFDFLENMGVKSLFELHKVSPEAITPKMVETLSNWTFLKSATTSLAFVALLVLLAKWVFVKYSTKKGENS